MAKDVKIELIYYKTKTDFSLEFGLHGNYPLRILSNSCDDLRSFFQFLKRAVSRSEIIITVGGYDEEGYIPELLGKSIGKNMVVPNYRQLGIITDRSYPLPAGAVPLSSERKLFGGFLIECGPQAIISLSDDRKTRLDITENTIAPYIAEHYAIYGNRYIAPASDTDAVSFEATEDIKKIEYADKTKDIRKAEDIQKAEDTKKAEEIIAPAILNGVDIFSSSPVTEPAALEQMTVDPPPEDTAVTAENVEEEIAPLPAEETAASEEVLKEPVIASAVQVEPKSALTGDTVLYDFNFDLSFPTDKDDDGDDGPTVKKHFNWLRILATLFIVIILLSFAFLYTYFCIFKSGDDKQQTSNTGSTSSRIDFGSDNDKTVQTVVIGSDDIFFNDTRSENEEIFEQAPISEDETEYPVPIPVNSETATSEKQTQSEKPASSETESASDTSGKPSTTSETTGSESSTGDPEQSSESASASETTDPSKETASASLESKTDTSSGSAQTESETASSTSSETSSASGDPTAQTTTDPLLSWDIEITVYNNKTSTYVTGTAAEIVEMITEAEIGSGSPPEALKAQAAAAYSWLITNGAAKGKKPTVPLNSNVGQRTKDAVAAVKGTVISYNGYFAETYYSAYSAGHTASYQDVWQDGKYFPYLQSVECPVDEKLKNFETVKVYTAEEIKTLIKDKLNVDVSGMPKDEWIVPVKYDGNDLYCVTVRIGGIEKTGSYLRSTFLSYGVRSTAFKVVYSEEDDTFTFTSRGWGHGVGMSQDGACAYAKDYGWTYIQILEHFYPGVTITKYTK